MTKRYTPETRAQIYAMLVGAKPYLLTSIEAQHDRWNSFSKVFICHAVAKYADTIATPDYMTGLCAHPG